MPTPNDYKHMTRVKKMRTKQLEAKNHTTVKKLKKKQKEFSIENAIANELNVDPKKVKELFAVDPITGMVMPHGEMMEAIDLAEKVREYNEKQEISILLQAYKPGIVSQLVKGAYIADEELRLEYIKVLLSFENTETKKSNSADINVSFAAIGPLPATHRWLEEMRVVGEESTSTLARTS